MVVWLVCFNDPPSYGGTVVTGRASHDSQVGGEQNQIRKQSMSPPGLLEVECRADKPTV
jgi:hypothetical protein